MKTIRKGLRRMVSGAGTAIREWTGEAEYRRLVRACRADGQVPPARGPYFARRLEEKYSQVCRCC
jgi:hypothetical protein